MFIKNFLAGVAVAVVSVIGFCSFTNQNISRNEIAEEVHVHAQGARCNGTVGCSCPGFSPITNGQVWQQSYCRHCGHAKSVHK